MNAFSANISVFDSWCNKCCTNIRTTTSIITSETEFIDVQCGYSIRIIATGPNCVTININNGTYFIIRNLFVNVPICICIPSEKCSKHYLKIKLNSITTS